MANDLTFVVLVTGLTGNREGPNAIQSYLLRHLAASANIRVVVFRTVKLSSQDIAPCAPSLNDSALELLRILQAERDKEWNAPTKTREKEKESAAVKDVLEDLERRLNQGPEQVFREASKVVSELGFEITPLQLSELITQQSTVSYKLIFLAHDIGGFVVKQSLLLANLNPSFDWIAMGTAAALFFGTPHTVPERSSWESVIVKMLADSESMLDFLSFLRDLPDHAAHLESDFEALSGSYHVVNFLANERNQPVVTQEHLKPSLYRRDKSFILNCKLNDMWDLGDETPWSDTILRVVRNNIEADTKDDPDEASRHLSLSLARLHPELHQLRAATRSWAPADLTSWITRDWLTKWIETPESCLLNVVGSPGSGQYGFASKVVNHLRSNNRLVVSFSVSNQTTPYASTVELFRSLCQQSLLSSSILRCTAHLCAWLLDGALFTNEIFRGLLCSIVSSYKGEGIYFVIHAINNYGQDIQRKLLDDLEYVKLASHRPLKVLLTSTSSDWYGDLKPDQIVDLNEEIKLEGELRTSAEAQLKNLAITRPVWKTLEPEVIRQLWTNSSSLFDVTQKVSLLRSFAPATPEEAETLVKKIPASFSNFFNHLEETCHFLSYRSLSWITHSIRPMTLSELAVCVAIDGAKPIETLTTAFLKRRIPWDIRSRLEESLGQVIGITGEKVKIRHPLYEEHILGHSRREGNIHLSLLAKCIDYLKSMAETWTINAEFERENRLVEYAALHWPNHYHHAVSVAPGEVTVSLEADIEKASGHVLSLFQEATYFRAWLGMFCHYTKAVPSRKRLPSTAIQVASSFGLTTVLEKLLLTLETENADEKELQRSLELAAEHGRVGAVRLLVEKEVRCRGALVKAARSGDIATMIELLKTHKGYISSTIGPGGIYTPILQAARFGHLDNFAVLLYEGADVKAIVPKTKLSAIHLAARVGQIDIVRLLIDEKVPIGLEDDRGYTALAYAAEAGFVDIVNQLIKTNTSGLLPAASIVPHELLVNGQTRLLDTPLHLAAAHGHIKVVQTLLDNEAKPQLQNHRGYTPLHCAAAGGFQDVVQILLDSLAEDPDSVPAMEVQPLQAIEAGSTVLSPLQLAVESQDLGTMAALRKCNRYNSIETLSLVLAPACRESNPDCVLYLLEWHHEEHPENVPLTEENENTALHLAAQLGNAELFQKVVNTPYADIDTYNKAGHTPLQEAGISGSFSILQGFSDSPHLSGSTQDGTNKTILHLAAEAGNLHIVKWLMKFPEHRRESLTEIEHTAIIIAARNDQWDVAKLLLESKYTKPCGLLLHLALQNGSTDVVRLAIRGAEIAVLDWKDPESGQTALHFAIHRRTMSLIEELIDAGIDPNIRDNTGMSPFAMAMGSNSLDIVRTLLDHCPRIAVDDRNMAGVTPFLQACENGPSHYLVINELLEKRGSDVDLDIRFPDDQDSHVTGKTPLHLAGLVLVRDDDESASLLELLLEKGADPNVRNARGSTPLFFAAEEGHLKAVKSLLDHKADPSARNKGGSTALHRTSQNGYVDCIEELVEKGAPIDAEKTENEDQTWGITPLVVAVQQLEQLAVEKLLELGATPGRALHFAAMTGDVEIVKLLLQRCEDPNLPDLSLGTPLHSAVLSESVETVNYLLSLNDLNVNVVGPGGWTPLTLAVMVDHSLVVTLIEAHADPDIRDHQGKTPLDHAIKTENTQTADYLCGHTRLDMGSGTGPRNHSPLYLASRVINDDMFKIVNTACRALEPQQYAAMCELALHAAIASDMKQQFDQLVAVKGVEATVEDDDGWTPLQCAVCYGRTEMVEILEKKLSEGEMSDTRKHADSQVVKEPRAWHRNDRHPALYEKGGSANPANIEVTKLALLDGLEPDEDDGLAMARADYCIPYGTSYYFEVTIRQGYREGDQNLGIGLCDDTTRLNGMLGFGSGLSYGYHADDGCTYATETPSKNQYSNSRDYSEGNTVGCGFDAGNRSIYFTKEGRRLAETFTNVKGKLYPAVFLSTREVGVCISAKFPQDSGGNFKYKWIEDAPTIGITRSSTAGSIDVSLLEREGTTSDGGRTGTDTADTSSIRGSAAIRESYVQKDETMAGESGEYR